MLNGTTIVTLPETTTLTEQSANTGTAEASLLRVPLEISNEDAIRHRAYYKWEAAGKPAGDGVDFWLAAEQELIPGH
ncbi:MAG: DUF2934 domain-containing protein [Planctomycetes bacterium]|nr:DUF2934 domain-containing protein [Planctomycetota bacterium]